MGACLWVRFVLFLLPNQDNLKFCPCRTQSVDKQVLEMVSRSSSRSSSTRRKNTDGKNAQCTPACTETLKSKMESRSTEQESLIGYVQNLSALKRNRKNTLDYASMTLQTASGNRDVLFYSSPKRRYWCQWPRRKISF